MEDSHRAAFRYCEGMVPVALTIAGSDPSGGAGIQADLKTFHEFNVYGAAAITLLTVQNTVAVTSFKIVDAGFIAAQVQSVLEDLPVAAAKTGALGNEDAVRAVASLARSFAFPLVVDPVMTGKHGAQLLTSDAQHAMRDELLPIAYLVTPNIPEAEVLTGYKIQSEAAVEAAAAELLALGSKAVLIKGGHLPGEPHDYLLTATASEWLPGTRVPTRHTHGTGCTYSAAITALLARETNLFDAIRMAKAFVQRAIATAPGLGSGYGPLNHWAASTSR